MHYGIHTRIVFLFVQRRPVLIRLRTLSIIAAIAIAALNGQDTHALTESTGGSHALLGMDTIGYLYSPSPGQESVYSSMRLAGSTHSIGRGWEGKAEGEFMFWMKTSAYYFELPELYLGTHWDSSPVQFHVGRMKQSWNKLDEKWSLGIWQPRFRWDYLNPEEVGLTGFFFTVKQPKFKVVAFASPLFIPDRGVPVETENGRFQNPTKSPFFASPPSTVNVMDAQTKVSYDIAMPPLTELVQKPGMSVMARLGAERGFWGSAAYAYKPVSQILLGYDNYLNLSSKRADVTLYPRVAYAQLVSLEAGHESERSSTWFSLLHERPVRDVTQANWVTQEISRSTAISSGVRYSMTSALEADLSYLRQWGGNANDHDPLNGDTTSRFEQRYPFQDAVSFGYNSKLAWLLGTAGNDLRSRTSMTYDIGHAGTIWQTEFSYMPRVAGRRPWTFTLGADLLGSNALEESSGSANDFISRYRADNRVKAGVAYVF